MTWTTRAIKALKQFEDKFIRVNGIIDLETPGKGRIIFRALKIRSYLMARFYRGATYRNGEATIPTLKDIRDLQ